MKSKLQRLIEVNYDSSSYSGRGMMGRTCLSVYTKESLGCFAGSIMHAIHNEESTPENDDDEIEKAIEHFKTVREDAMGMGSVFYFSGVTYYEP